MVRPDPNSRPRFVAPIRFRNMIWIVVIGGIWAAAEVFGTPHLRASYAFAGRPSRPYFLSCSYWGLHPFEITEAHGVCPLFVMVRSASSGS